jgi:hypothetical protein
MTWNVALLTLPLLATLAGTAPKPEAIAFAKGSSGAVVKGAAARGERRYYALSAREGQELKAEVAAVEDNAAFALFEPGWRLVPDGDGIVDVKGKALPGAAAGEDAKRWSGRLPRSGSYLLVVGGTRGGTEYTLRVSVR